MVTSPVLASAPVTRRRWAVAGALIGALLALVLFAPARWLGAALDRWSGGHLQLVNGQVGLASTLCHSCSYEQR